MLNVIEPLLSQEFNFNNATIGWLGAAYFYAMAILLTKVIVQQAVAQIQGQDVPRQIAKI